MCVPTGELAAAEAELHAAEAQLRRWLTDHGGHVHPALELSSNTGSGSRCVAMSVNGTAASIHIMGILCMHDAHVHIFIYPT